MKKPNIQMYDTLRCIAIICIVFAHIDSYTNLIFFKKYDEYFAYIGLILFFFISGFLFQYNSNIKSKKDIVSSIKKRAQRIYPLFWLSILITTILDQLNLNVLHSDMGLFDLLVTMVGLQGLFPVFKVPYALWYIGVILIYYVISYILICYAKNLKQIIMYSMFIFFSLSFLKYEFGIIHVNALLYYFVFIAGFITGFICNSESLTSETIKSISITSIFLVYGMFAIYLKTCSFMKDRGINKSYVCEYGILSSLNNNIFKLALINSIVLFLGLIVVGIIIYKINSYVSKLDIFKYKTSKVAYSAYAVYLFHIQILSIIKEVMNVIVFRNEIADHLMLILGIPLIFIIGYQIQKKFDRLYS